MCHSRYLAQGSQVLGPDEPQQWDRMHRGAFSLQSGGVADALRLPRPAAMPLSRFLEARHVRVLRIDVEGDEVQVLESGGKGVSATSSLHYLPDRYYQGRLPGGATTRGRLPGSATTRGCD